MVQNQGSNSNKPCMDIVCLAWTKMARGKCFAGIDKNTGKWARIVPEYGELQEETFAYQAQTFLCQDYNILRVYHKGNKNSSPPHSEDYIWDSNNKCQLIGKITNTEAFLSKVSENNLLMNKDKFIHTILKEQNKSLILVGPVIITKGQLFKNMHNPNEIDLRFFFEIPSVNYVASKVPNGGIKCTSIYWTNYFKKMMHSRNSSVIFFDDNEFRDMIGNYKNLYISIGLTREFEGENWPMIIGIHPTK
ncbi:MAG: hypothetical protein KO464_10640 [Candidatus Methanofastidiosum sp.]|nr:hypothetical protein [Methanofastidiosum sp.]